MIDLNELGKLLRDNTRQKKYVTKNKKQIHASPRNMLMLCTSEIMDAYAAVDRQGYTPKEMEGKREKNKEALLSSLAEIICYSLTIAGEEKMDIEAAVRSCAIRNFSAANGSEAKNDKPQ